CVDSSGARSFYAHSLHGALPISKYLKIDYEVKLKSRNKVSPDFSMASMTDIVFLLLIFFMLTANSPNALDLLLPKGKGKSTNTQDRKSARLNSSHVKISYADLYL